MQLIFHGNSNSFHFKFRSLYIAFGNSISFAIYSVLFLHSIRNTVYSYIYEELDDVFGLSTNLFVFGQFLINDKVRLFSNCFRLFCKVHLSSIFPVNLDKYRFLFFKIFIKTTTYCF